MAVAQLVSGASICAAKKDSYENIKTKDNGFIEDTNWVSPGVLTGHDIKLYKKIFSLQDKGKWLETKGLREKLNSDILIGHLDAHKYLHPTKYRSKYLELLQWMRKYADLPQARQIYALALRRRPANWKMPPRPVGRALRGNGAISSQKKIDMVYRSSRKRSKRQRIKIFRFQKHIRRLIHQGWPTGAYKKLSSETYQKALDPIEIAIARAEIAHGYFIFGKDSVALKLAEESLEEFGAMVPIAAWTAGLASWRLNNTKRAADFFELLQENKRAKPTFKATGAFWASRAHLLNRRPKESIKWLKKAAEVPDSFYGMIARRALGMSVGIDVSPLSDTREFSQKLSKFQTGKRAVALLQLSRHRDAERELRMLFYSISEGLRPSLMAFASANGLPGLAMRSAGLLRENGFPPYYPGLFPLPAWPIPKGVSIDPALIYAVVRQESQFNIKAKSGRGARGLMQLMPRTAAAIGKNKKLRRGKGRDTLFDPVINISLGSRYLSHLIGEGSKPRNLFQALAAYNAGPGKLGKWEKSVNYKKDPLMFIESIPSPETRQFIERVLLGLWIYRFRLDEPTPTLRHLAEGAWPNYESVAGKTSGRINNARN